MYHVDNLPVQLAFCFRTVAFLLYAQKLLKSKVGVAKLWALVTRITGIGYKNNFVQLIHRTEVKK